MSGFLAIITGPLPIGVITALCVLELLPSNLVRRLQPLLYAGILAGLVFYYSLVLIFFYY